MSRKVNLIFQGFYNHAGAVQSLQDLIIKYGSDTINIVDKMDKADMMVDITDINGMSDLVEECNFTIAAAKKIQKYEKKRKRIIKEAVGTSRQIKDRHSIVEDHLKVVN